MTPLQTVYAHLAMCAKGFVFQEAALVPTKLFSLLPPFVKVWVIGGKTGISST